MKKKWFAGSIVASCALAFTFGLSACSDDSSGTSASVDSGNEISIPVSGESSSLTVSESSSSVDAVSSSSSVKPASSVSSAMSSSAVSISSEEETDFINKDWRKDCLAKINEYRATENLQPLAFASEEKQTCADKQAAADLSSNKAHGHFGDCGEFAQNSGPNFSTSWQTSATDVSDYYLKKMWEDEKALVTSGERDPNKNEDYPYIGHYLNMKNKNATEVACGISLSADGKTGWFNVDFF